MHRSIFRLLMTALTPWSLASPAKAAWREASSAHFVVYADEDEARLRDYALKLEHFDHAMRIIRGLDDPPVGRANRVVVYVVKDEEQVEKLNGSRGVSGFYIPAAGASEAVTYFARPPKRGEYDNRLTTLFHEYTHHFLTARWPNAAYPWWFSEGYADFCSTAQFAPDGTLSFGVASPYHIRNLGLLYGRPLSTPTMVGSTYQSLAGTALYALYARGWLLVHYLQFEKSRTGQLARYLDAINSGTSGPAAAKAAFGDLRALEDELEQYRQRRAFMQVKVPPDAFTADIVSIRALDPGESAMMPIRIRVRNPTAQLVSSVAEEARRTAKPFGDSAPAQSVLAQAELAASNYEAAIQAADRALKIDPSALEAMLTKGRARFAILERDHVTDPVKISEARSWFLKANRADPEDPRPLIAFYRSFTRSKQAPTANAVAGLRYAFALAPQDLALRLTVARQDVADGKLAEATAALKPIAYNPHGGSLAGFAAEELAILAKGDRTAVLTHWDGPTKPGQAVTPDQ